jgi:hypothetical protein
MMVKAWDARGRGFVFLPPACVVLCWSTIPYSSLKRALEIVDRTLQLNWKIIHPRSSGMFRRDNALNR